jgi:hypothetical protein
VADQEKPVPDRQIGKLFHIGSRLLDANAWIDADDRLGTYLDEKERLRDAHPAETFAAEEGTEVAQAELLSLLVAYLPVRFPAIYRRRGDAIEVADRSVPIVSLEPPLITASRLVQEDLVLMRRGDSGWRLAAASLSFPSSWRLREKFGRPMHEVHAPVPGFGAGTRNAMLIERMFDNLRPEMPMVRWNWSIYGDAELFHPSPHADQRLADGAFLRLERQTLRRLPASGDIVFTIRIYVDPLDAVTSRDDGAATAKELMAQLGALDPAQLAYKGMTEERDAVMTAARGGGGAMTRRLPGAPRLCSPAAKRRN